MRKWGSSHLNILSNTANIPSGKDSVREWISVGIVGKNGRDSLPDIGSFSFK